MALRFTVLASGSGGNSSLIQAGGFGLLLDVGLGPRQLASRLAAAGASWDAVQAVILTHTHTDHWNERTFARLHRLRIPIYCHAEHVVTLQTNSEMLGSLQAENLVRVYEAGVELALAPGLRCRPLPICHDGGATFGFRFEGAADLFGRPCALGYAADLGCWDSELAQALADVDLLAIEFNHDVAMEYASGRTPRLIARVLGDEGHLSNIQAAALLQEVLRLSTPARLRQVVQLHLSRECNHPDLADEAARAVLGDAVDIEVHAASQHRPGPTFQLGAAAAGARSPRRRARLPRAVKASEASVRQLWLPGFEGEAV